MRGKLDRVNFRKDFRDSYYRCVISNNPRNNCGTYFGSSSLLASKVAKKGNQRTAPDRLVILQFAPFTIFLSHHSMPGHA